MPTTFGGQVAIFVGLAGVLGMMVKGWRTYKTDKKAISDALVKKAIEDKQHREWLEELWLEYCRKTGVSVSDDLIRKHIRINGNINKSSAEKDRIYGPDRPRDHDSDQLIIEDGKARRKAAAND